MSTRRFLDLQIQRITGHDIRLAGIWKALPDLDAYSAEISAALGIPKKTLLRCRDIADVLDLMHVRYREPAESTRQELLAA
jgi:hypothetical protein